jgi:hypothetical protein
MIGKLTGYLAEQLQCLKDSLICRSLLREFYQRDRKCIDWRLVRYTCYSWNYKAGIIEKQY